MNFVTKVSIGVIFACLLQAKCSGKGYQQEALTLHNLFRAKHLTPALVLNDSLNSLASQCAEYYADKGFLDHSCPHKNATTTGENIFSWKGHLEASEFTKIAINTWYDEGINFNYSKAVFSKKTGNFTQLVWAYTRELGFGLANLNSYYVAVALYTPKGNAREHFENNVLPMI